MSESSTARFSCAMDRLVGGCRSRVGDKLPEHGGELLVLQVAAQHGGSMDALFANNATEQLEWRGIEVAVVQAHAGWGIGPYFLPGMIDKAYQGSRRGGQEFCCGAEAKEWHV